MSLYCSLLPTLPSDTSGCMSSSVVEAAAAAASGTSPAAAAAAAAAHHHQSLMAKLVPYINQFASQSPLRKIIMVVGVVWSIVILLRILKKVITLILSPWVCVIQCQLVAQTFGSSLTAFDISSYIAFCLIKLVLAQSESESDPHPIPLSILSLSPHPLVDRHQRVRPIPAVSEVSRPLLRCSPLAVTFSTVRLPLLSLVVAAVRGRDRTQDRDWTRAPPTSQGEHNEELSFRHGGYASTE